MLVVLRVCAHRGTYSQYDTLLVAADQVMEILTYDELR